MKNLINMKDPCSTSCVMVFIGAACLTVYYIIFGFASVKKKNYNLHDNHDYPLGLINTGNKCFINAGLQALAASNKLIKALEIRSHQFHHLILLKILLKTLNAINLGHSSITSSLLLSALRSYGWSFYPGEQDAHEFLLLLCSSLDEEIDKASNETFENTLVQIQQQVLKEDNCKSFYLINRLPFSGLIANQLICPKCKFKSPKLLILHLQRTIWLSSGQLIKESKHVDFPQYFSIDPFLFCKKITNENKHDINASTFHYKLCAVITHLGDIQSGHFVTYRMGLNNENWYYVSDDHVQQINIDAVLSSQAYMLFYERCV